MKQVAPLRYDVIFKKAFSHPELFTALVEDFFGIPLEIDQVENDKAFSPSVGKVAIKFDLFAQDTKNRVIVEMQHAHYSDTFERFLYYQCVAMAETIASSKSYKFPVTVFTLVFFTGKKRPHPDSGILIHDFDPRDFVTGEIIKNVYARKHRLIFVFTNDTPHPDTPKKCVEWMQAIDDSLDGEIDEDDYTNPHIKRLFELIELEQITPEEYARMKDDYNQEESEKQAFEEGKKETARNLKALGALTEEQIASVTGLTLEEIKAL